MNRNMEAIVWAMNARGLDLAAWRVLVTLARKVGKRGFDVWPAHKSLSDDCEISVSSVRRALARLEAEEFIKIIPRLDEAGDRTSNKYRLQVHTKMTFPHGEELEISPDDVDDEPSIPPERGPVKLNRPLLAGEQTVRSNRTDGLFTREQGMIQEEPIQEEESPSSDEEDTPSPGFDLFGNPIPTEEPIPLERYVEDRWHELKADEPRIADIDVLTPSRLKGIEARAAEIVRGRKKRGIETTPESVWDQIFQAIRNSTFLCGRSPPGKGRTGPFKLTLDFVLTPKQFGKIIEGAYDDDERYRDKAGFDHATGREFGPGEETARRALERLRASRERRADRGSEGGSDQRGNGGDSGRALALPR